MLRALAKIGLAILLPMLALGAIVGRNADNAVPLARSADEAISSSKSYAKAFPSEFDGLDENALVRAIQKAEKYKIRDIASWYDKLADQPDSDQDRIVEARLAEIVRFDTAAKADLVGAYKLPFSFRYSLNANLLMVEGYGQGAAITYFGDPAQRYFQYSGLEWLRLGGVKRTRQGMPTITISKTNGVVIMTRGTAQIVNQAICFEIGQVSLLVDRTELPRPSVVRPIRLAFDALKDVGPMCQLFYGETDKSLRSALFRSSDLAKLVNSDEGPHRVEFRSGAGLSNLDVPATDAAVLDTFFD